MKNCTECRGPVVKGMQPDYFLKNYGDVIIEMEEIGIYSCQDPACGEQFTSFYKLGPMSDLLRAIDYTNLKKVILGLRDDTWVVLERIE